MVSKRFKLFVGLLFLFSMPAILRAQRMTPQSLNFGSVPDFTTSSLQVTMLNAGPWPLTIRSIKVPSNYSETITQTLNNCRPQGAIAVINPNSSCTMTVTFAPVTQGTLSGSIQVTSDTNGVNSSSSVAVTGIGAPALTGYINPKYIVVSVVYAPPGSNSFVNYSTSALVSSTHTVTHTFSSSVTTSVSVTGPGGIFAFFGGTRSSSFSNTLTQQSQDATSVTASYTNTSSLQLFGPGPNNNCGSEAGDFVGIDHNCDLIKVWVNPVMLFTLVGPGGSGVQWNGYGSSGLDSVAPIHIVDVLVGCLNGHLAATDSRCAPAFGEFQRTWAANENWPAGEGPGLTANDFSNILAADPWGQCAANAPIGSSTCPTYSTPGFVLLPPQFTLSSQTNIPYRQGTAQTGLSVSTTSSTTQSQESKTTHSQTYGIEDAFTGTGFLMGFAAKVGVSRTLTTAYEVQNSTTHTGTFTGMANITGPACTGNPCNPSYPPSPQTYGEATELNIFVDNFFGTFAFLPAAYN